MTLQMKFLDHLKVNQKLNDYTLKIPSSPLDAHFSLCVVYLLS